MQGFNLKDLLESVGPNASLIFASWIFLSFLQQRYSAAFERYRSLITEYREHPEQDARKQSLVEQIVEYKRRCQQMRLATQIGVTAAIFLIVTLILGALNVLFGDHALLKITAAGCSVVGLGLVIIAATMVLKENGSLQRVLDAEIKDVPEIQEKARRMGV